MFTTIVGNDLSFIDEGQGQAILLVHGFPLSRAIWQSQIEVFQKNFRVIAPDLRGRESLAKRAEREGASAVAEQMLPKMLAPATVSSRPELVEHAISKAGHLASLENPAEAIARLQAFLGKL